MIYLGQPDGPGRGEELVDVVRMPEVESRPAEAPQVSVEDVLAPVPRVGGEEGGQAGEGDPVGQGTLKGGGAAGTDKRGRSERKLIQDCWNEAKDSVPTGKERLHVLTSPCPVD